MAASNLTASAINAVQFKIMEMFPQGGTPGIDRDPRNNRVQTAAALTENNSARATPIYDPTGSCVAVEVMHIVGDHEPDDTDVSAGFATNDCDLPDGDGVRTAKTTYDHNLFAQEVALVPDGDCKNLFEDPSAEGADKVAQLIADKVVQAMLNLRAKVNTEALTFLAATSTGVNRDTGMPGFITFNAGASAFDVNLAGFFSDPNSLTFLDTITNLNDMPAASFMHSGRNNFYNSVIDAKWGRLNDNQRSLIRYETGLDAPMSFDTRMDAALGGKNTFVVSPESYAAWNVAHYGPSPTVVDTAKNLFVYSIPDPVWQIRENGVTRPVRYNVLYQKVCTGRNVLGIPKFDHKFVIQYLGGLVASPAAADNHTGILRFRDISGI
jgi:hypothetical protein